MMEMQPTSPRELPADAEIVPQSGDGAVLPVEIIPLLPAKPNEHPPLIKAVTGQAVRVRPGEYLVQAVVPFPDEAAVATRARRVTVHPGAHEEVSLQDVIAEARKWVQEASRLAQTVQTRVDQLLQTIQTAAPQVAQGARTAAEAALSGIRAELNAQVEVATAAAAQEHAGVVPSPGATPEAGRAALLAAALRRVRDRLDSRVAAAAVPSTEVATATNARIARAAHSVGRTITRGFVAVARPMLGSVADLADKLSTSTAEAAGSGIPAGAGATTSTSPTSIETSGAVLPGAAAAPTAAPDVAVLSAAATAEIGLVEADPVALLDCHFDGAACHPPGFAPVAKLSVDGPPWDSLVERPDRLLVICGDACEAIALIPVDDSGPTSVSVSLSSARPVEVTSMLDRYAYPRVRLRFQAPELQTLWEFMGANAFEEAVQIAAAQAELLPAVVADGSRYRTPLAALLGAYVLLRANRIDALQKCVDVLRPREADFPDAVVIRTELLARQGKHKEAVRTLVGLQPGRPPLLRLGVAYALQRLRLYRKFDASNAGPPEDTARGREAARLSLDTELRAQLATLEAPLAELAAAMDPTQLNLVLIPKQQERA